MYRLPPGTKGNPTLRWSLSERVFFACGACHILAFAFLETYPEHGFEAVWMRPAKGYTGSHIVVVRDAVAFDYHGYSNWPALVTHTEVKAKRWWPEWTADLIPLPKAVLVSEVRSRLYDGLWLREPKQFLHDALPRAHAFLSRFPAPP